MAETCNSRSFSWLVKSCLPDPRREIARAPPENPHCRRPAAVSPAAASPISSLPDDLLLECLSRVPLSSLPSLPLVCRRFSLLLDSAAFLDLRRAHGRLRRTLHALSFSDLGLLVSAAIPADDPAAVAWDCASPIPLPPQILDGSFSHARLAAVGRSIYIIGRGATLRYDTWTGAVAPRAPTLFARKKFAAAAIGGKIYVAGGTARTSAVEEYDPAADAWRVVADAPLRRYGCVAAAAGGVFYVIGGLRVGGREAAGSLDAHVCAGSMDAYRVGTGAWVRGRAGAAAAAVAVVPGGGCVVGACGVGTYVYVLASHAVEVSFWRWEVGRGRRVGEWTRLEPPPVPGRGRLGGAVRFSCAAVGEDKVVALAHVPSTAGAEGAVLVYDIAGGEWTRGPDLPRGLRRAAFAFVEC
ncbi:F-box/kelch-repeat protein At5g26960 [Elaeis guineensis]|uniref:F-box/kelch-repeat protein At5g26960 n=1 Tax=Elaeis guineensis var. tenera TaxID=51953 RepID=A0A6I9QCA7_ELAGV|nr:F-box/kelch-repeat protein At5g26960 [Elaeis guineensis]